MRFQLPSWIERLLGIEAEPGEGTVWSLEHTWDWAPWATLLFLGFAVAFVVGVYLRENRRVSRMSRMGLAAIRVALVLVLLLMLARYALSRQRTGLPYVVVLIDDSLSMSTVDRYEDSLRKRIARRTGPLDLEQPSRWNLARTLLLEDEGALLQSILDDYKLRVYYTTGARPSRQESPDALLAEIRATEPTGESTRLGTAVRALLDDLRGTAPAAVVLLTDGINTEGPDLEAAAAYARRRGVPLFPVGLGDDKPVRDLELDDLLVDEVVFVGDVVNFEFTLTGSGYAGRKVKVVLRERDGPAALCTLEATVGSDGYPQRLRLPHRPEETRSIEYVVEVEPLEGEADTRNNRQTRTVTVSDEKIRVLFVQEYPSFEFRYLRNMLHRDTSIELHTVLQEADPEHAEQDPSALRGFPVRREELFAYDVIILGDVNPALLNDAMLRGLVDFVGGQASRGSPGRGGALLFLAGPKYMPLAYRDTVLAPLLPVDLSRIPTTRTGQSAREGFTLKPTGLGLESPQMQLGETLDQTRSIWKNLPPLYWFLEVPREKPGARVLARHPSRVGDDGRPFPLICMQYVGSGKVLFHAMDNTWRWRWRVGDVFFARYWGQTIRALCQSKLTDEDKTALLSTDRREYRRGESVQLRLRFYDERLAPAADDGVTVVLEHQGHKTVRVKLHRGAIGRGIFEGRLGGLSIGSYHAWVAIPTTEGKAPSADFEVVAPPGEFKRVRMEVAEMQRAADRTKGRFYTFFDAKQLKGDLPPGRQVPVESLPPTPLWNKWPLLVLFLLLLTTEWVLRKAAGMV